MPNKDEEMVIGELNLCRDEIKSALDRACVALRRLPRGTFIRAQAESYWVGHIKAAMGHPDFPGEISMKHTIEALKEH